MEKVKKLLFSEAFKYLFFGGLTTLVYYIFMTATLFAIPKNPNVAAISELIGQITSIIFAFFTNKKWVFEHKSNHVFLDFLNFAAGRAAFAVIAIVLKWWFGDVHPSILMNLFHLNFKWTILVFSLILQVANILLNYFYSKFLVFRKKKEEVSPED
jgi:putative flippase GtrA